MQARTKKAHEAQLGVVFFLEHILELVAQCHHRRHVGFVESRQHGGGVLRILEAPRDGLPQP